MSMKGATETYDIFNKEWLLCNNLKFPASSGIQSYLRIA